MTNRRDFLKAAAAGAFAGIFSNPGVFASAAGTSKKRKPNVVLFFVDDMGCNDVGCYGENRIKTPNIDRLAEQGMKFTNAHAPAAICTPSRYGLLTGRYCWRTWLKRGVIANTPLLVEPGSFTMASLFKDQGYKTACIGKWHLGTRMYPPNDFDGETHFRPPIHPGPNEIGFDYFFGLPVGHFYPPYVYMENDTIFRHDPEDPVRLIQSPEAGIRGYLQEGGSDARWNEDEVLSDLTIRARQYIKDNRDEPFFLYFPTSSPHTPYTPAGKFKGKSDVGDYGDFVMETDWSVGQIIETLKECGVENDTLFIFTSDNGGVDDSTPAFTEYNYNPNGKWRGDKGDIYEGGLRVPFVAKWPGRIKAGSQSGQLTVLTDMLATLAAVLDVEIPEYAGPDSCNILPAFFGNENLHRDRGIVLHSRGGMFAIIRGDWKYIHGSGDGEFVPGNHPTPDQDTEGQLFNLKTDPYETNDRIKEYPEKARVLRNLLVKYYSQGNSKD
jgi:arylsulfatase A